MTTFNALALTNSQKNKIYRVTTGQLYKFSDLDSWTGADIEKLANLKDEICAYLAEKSAFEGGIAVMSIMLLITETALQVPPHISAAITSVLATQHEKLIDEA